MKNLVIQLVTAIIASTSFPVFADQHQAPCDNQEDMEESAHCVVINKLGIPPYSCKYIRIDSYYNKQFVAASGDCLPGAEMTSSLFKDWVGIEDGANKPGNYSDVYMQCDNKECQNTKTLGVDNFVLNADKTSSPYKFTVTRDLAFGATYVDENSNGFELRFLLSTHGSCKNDWGVLKYCGSIKSAANINKYVKFEDNDSFEIMCANNQTRFGFGTEQYQNFSAGTQHLKIFQCDNAQCLHPILIGEDSVSNDTHGNVDHTSYTVKLKPAYGDNCTPVF